MKKLFVIFMAFVCAAAFIGCGNEEESLKSDEGNKENISDNADNNDSENIIDNSEITSLNIRVNSRFEPYTFDEKELIEKIEAFLETAESFEETELPEGDIPKGVYMYISCLSDGEEVTQINTRVTSENYVTIDGNHYTSDNDEIKDFFKDVTDYINPIIEEKYPE